MKKPSIYTILLGLLISSHAYSETQDQLTLAWEDLIPERAVIKNPIEALSKEEYYALNDDEYQAIMRDYQVKVEQAYAAAPVVTELDKKEVTLSGYSVILDF